MAIVLKRLLRALPVILLVSVITLFLEHYGWLKSLETATLDRLFVLREKVPARDVVLVVINDDDYRQLFHETSPLDPATLTDLIDAVAKNQPKLIAVDIDTSAAIFKDMKISPEWPPIVWARGAHEARSGNNVLVLEGVLGKPTLPSALTSGLAIMPLDSDSQIRHFQREYHASEGESGPALRVDSFHWAVTKKYCEIATPDSRCKKLLGTPITPKAAEADLILNLAIDPYAFDPPIRASRVLDQVITGNAGGSPPLLLSIKDRIVLIGGTYEASSDYHDTVNGPKYGVDLTAIAVESELSGSGLRETGHFGLMAMEVAAGLALVILNYFFPIGWKHLATLAAIPLIAILGSLIAFSSFALWANFVPTLLATQIHGLYDKLAEAKRLQREVQSLRERVSNYEREREASHPTSSISAESPDSASATESAQAQKPEHLNSDSEETSRVSPSSEAQATSGEP